MEDEDKTGWTRRVGTIRWGGQIEIRMWKVGDEQREIDIREGLEMIT